MKERERAGDTYNPTSKQEKRSQRIERQRDHSTNGGDEAPSKPDQRSHERDDADESLVIGDGGCTAEMLCCDEVRGEREDYDGAEELGMCELLTRE